MFAFRSGFFLFKSKSFMLYAQNSTWVSSAVLSCKCRGTDCQFKRHGGQVNGEQLPPPGGDFKLHPP